MTQEHTFRCPLPNGLHARPASLLAEVAARSPAEITLTNARTGAVANAKSVLEIIALDVREDDRCRIDATGADAAGACAALREFVGRVLPSCDEALPASRSAGERTLPRALRQSGVRWQAGTVACPGIGQGDVVQMGAPSLPAEIADEPGVTPERERERVRQATRAVRSTLEARLAARPSSVEAGVLRAHLAIAGDTGLEQKIGVLVAEGRSAGQAIVEAARFFAGRLQAAESAYVRERSLDIQDIGLQLLEQIYGERVRGAAIMLAGPSVVAAESLTPRQFLALDRRFLRGLVLEHAGVTSHAVILARSFDVPTLTGVAEARSRLEAGREAIVDANLGLVITEVSAPVRRYYARELGKLARRAERCARHAHAPAVTRDGQTLEVAANVATAEELLPAFARGADGIGLFRTEMLFMEREAAPSEEEQFAVYVQAARAARAAGGAGAGKERTVILRTFDVGGDKPVPYLHLPQEANPFLGYRGVRIYREHRALFVAQLRAILRASAFGPVWTLLPMIAALDEVRWVKAEIAALQAELEQRGVAYDKGMRLGVMVEVPSAAFLIDQLAEEVDFFSIGTNDLVQYFLAVERASERVSELYSARHPSFLRLLAKIVADARRAGRWIGMCGEMTRSPRNLPLLLGLGLDEISTAAPEIPALKAAIAQSSAAECSLLLDQALACRSLAAVEELVEAFRGRAADQGLLDPEFVVSGSDSASKEEAIKELVDAFYAAGRSDHPEAVEEALWAREAVYSTGLGHGFAIPHCKTDAISASSIGVLRLARPVEWGSNDGQRVSCVILLAMRASEPSDVHLRVFAKLARKLVHAEFRERMLAAPDRAGVLACLAQELGLGAGPA